MANFIRCKKEEDNFDRLYLVNLDCVERIECPPAFQSDRRKHCVKTKSGKTYYTWTVGTKYDTCEIF